MTELTTTSKLVTKQVKVSIVDGAEGAVIKNLLPDGFEVDKFDFSIENSPSPFQTNGLKFTDSLNKALEKALRKQLCRSISIAAVRFNSDLVDRRKKSLSSLMVFSLQKDGQEQEICLHSVFRNPTI